MSVPSFSVDCCRRLNWAETRATILLQKKGHESPVLACRYIVRSTYLGSIAITLVGKGRIELLHVIVLHLFVFNGVHHGGRVAHGAGKGGVLVGAVVATLVVGLGVVHVVVGEARVLLQHAKGCLFDFSRGGIFRGENGFHAASAPRWKGHVALERIDATEDFPNVATRGRVHRQHATQEIQHGRTVGVRSGHTVFAANNVEFGLRSEAIPHKQHGVQTTAQTPNVGSVVYECV